MDASLYIGTVGPEIQADLDHIVSKGRFLWERLTRDNYIARCDQHSESSMRRRLARWCHVISPDNESMVHKRLEWDGLNLKDMRPYVAEPAINPEQPLPLWTQTLGHIMQVAAGFDFTTENTGLIDPENPIPFEEVLLPALKVARQQLLRHFDISEFNPHVPPFSLLSAAAYASLERHLMSRLSEISTQTLHTAFSQKRPFGHRFFGLFDLESDKNPDTTHYHTFVREMHADGLRDCLRTYPVLGRLIATVVNLWVESTCEFLQRLAQDQTALAEMFQTTPEPLGKVNALNVPLSDAHNRGRVVMALTFASGVKLLYKPKALALNVALNNFLRWCNESEELLDFKIVQTLNRGDYGWVHYRTVF